MANQEDRPVEPSCIRPSILRKDLYASEAPGHVSGSDTGGSPAASASLLSMRTAHPRPEVSRIKNSIGKQRIAIGVRCRSLVSSAGLLSHSAVAGPARGAARSHRAGRGELSEAVCQRAVTRARGRRASHHRDDAQAWQVAHARYTLRTRQTCIRASPLLHQRCFLAAATTSPLPPIHHTLT